MNIEQMKIVLREILTRTDLTPCVVGHRGVGKTAGIIQVCREIDRRIRFLTKRLDELTVVDAGPRKDADRVYFGAWVTTEDEEGQTQRYRLVGPDEFDARAGRISVDSPVGRALMGRRLGDEVVIRRPKGEIVCEILEIDYEEEE